jgi:hypothetical protein
LPVGDLSQFNRVGASQIIDVGTTNLCERNIFVPTGERFLHDFSGCSTFGRRRGHCARVPLLLTVRTQEVPSMAQAQYGESLLATAASTVETPRFADLERDLFPAGDAVDEAEAEIGLDHLAWSVAGRRPNEGRSARAG